MIKDNMKNIHILPTDKPSRLGRFIDTNNLFLRTTDDIPRGENINIYITNDEEIKEGDWVYENNLNQETKVYQIIKRDDKLMFFRFRSVPIWLDKNQHGCKKIILTTDSDLIEDGIQAINDEFLEWFVKNSSCEFVEITDSKTVKDHIWDGTKNGEIIWEKEIIIPKEERERGITITHVGKVETLEEVVNNFKKTDVYINEIKQEQERSYSEEEVEVIARDAYAMGRSNILIGGFNTWFEIKKK